MLVIKHGMSEHSSRACLPPPCRPQAQLGAVGAAPDRGVPSGEDLPGRQSGALDWRLSRGEAGAASAQPGSPGLTAAAAGGAAAGAPAVEASEGAVAAASAAFVAVAPVPIQDVVLRIVRNIVQEPTQLKFRRGSRRSPAPARQPAAQCLSLERSNGCRLGCCAR